MSQETYGYSDDTSNSGPALNFGLNSGVARMTHFAFNPNGGKEGTPQEVLDVKFEVNGKEVNYRLFPIEKAFIKGGGETTDPSHEAFKSAIQEFNASVVHILKAFVPVEMIKQALSVPIANFAQFCNVTTNILPTDFRNKRLDIFGQWQWQMTGENTVTFTNIPKNVKHGKWLCAHIPPVGQWVESKLNGGLAYIDSENHSHPFSRNKWFMDSNFARQQREDSLSDVTPNVTASPASSASNTTDWN